jgi:plasmid stabilization system protein ParE
MAAELIIAPEVEQDLAEASAWHESRRAGLGEDFLSCVDACIAAILRMPQTRAIVYKQYRRALVRRFPYAVFYEHEAQIVTVYAVLHCSRNPERWRSRLP